ncbi:hypothetical protein POM88_036632 [Heracleum sosnowskyi]|uniref:Uncharacterized protein n=1 Tax=Heracleum sosnowskyi TaxID=360622 RepID=A0AAD8HR10_9APIA|nr:hypothetical protein POM88_036632 [Heracleum sosnowskyi]
MAGSSQQDVAARIAARSLGRASDVIDLDLGTGGKVNIVQWEDFLNEIELQGAHAEYAGNAYFQSAIHQAKVLRDSEWAAKKESKRLTKEVKIYENLTLAAEKEISNLRAKNQKLVMDRATAIDDYMGSDDFLQFIDDHDDRVFHGFFTKGWDQALSSVIAQHPGLFDPAKDFQSPYPVIVATTSGAHQESSTIVGENEEVQEGDPMLDDQVANE